MRVLHDVREIRCRQKTPPVNTYDKTEISFVTIIHEKRIHQPHIPSLVEAPRNEHSYSIASRNTQHQPKNRPKNVFLDNFLKVWTKQLRFLAFSPNSKLYIVTRKAPSKKCESVKNGIRKIVSKIKDFGWPRGLIPEVGFWARQQF